MRLDGERKFEKETFFERLDFNQGYGQIRLTSGSLENMAISWHQRRRRIALFTQEHVLAWRWAVNIAFRAISSWKTGHYRFDGHRFIRIHSNRETRLS